MVTDLNSAPYVAIYASRPVSSWTTVEPSLPRTLRPKLEVGAVVAGFVKVDNLSEKDSEVNSPS